MRVVALYREAMAWLGSPGLDQWQSMPGSEERIAAEVPTGKVWVVKNSDGQVMATIKLDTHADPEF